jgi:hypothetical protein
MFRRRRGESRGCCVVIPIGRLLPGLGVVLLSGLALAGLLWQAYSSTNSYAPLRQDKGVTMRDPT